MRNLDCRWITCDQHFKYSTCLLKKAFADKLYDAFEAKSYKTPWCSAFLNDACDCHEGCKFENARSEDGMKSNDAEADEAEAEVFASRLVASLGDSGLAAMYKKLLEISIAKNIQELSMLNEEIDGKKNELMHLSLLENASMKDVAESTRSLLDAWKIM